MSITPGFKSKRKLLRVALKRAGDIKGVDYIAEGADVKAILCKNLNVNPWQTEQISRDLDDGLSGGQPVIHTGDKMTITGSIEMAGSGTANVPTEYAPLLELSGYQQTVNANNVSYARILNAADEIDGTLYFHWEGMHHIMLGAKATLTRKGKVGELSYLDFECMGIYGGTVESTIPAADFTDYMQPVPFSMANTEFSFDGQLLNMIEYEMSMGNVIEYDEGTEIKQMFIDDWSAEGKYIVEAPSHSTFDPFAIARSGAFVPASFTHGVTPGNIFTDSSTGVQILGIEPGEYKGKLTWEISVKEVRDNDGILTTL